MKNNPGIYIVKNLVNGKVYVGSSITVLARVTAHKSELRKGKHRNKYSDALGEIWP